ncbi:MAG: hypothetical protein FWH14_00195 [Oscillospiraceae bacterium]|nr:hypothetical protein [Oscillospiraceae bacterium]
MKKAIVVCTGNICRSPMGEIILAKRAEGLGWIVESRGVQADVGSEMTRYSRIALEELGYDVPPHSAKQLTHEDITGSDLLIVMTTGHIKAIAAMVPQARDKCLLLGVPDPWGYDIETYRECRDSILENINKIEL